MEMVESLLGGPDFLGHEIRSDMDFFELSREGITKKALMNLAEGIHLSMKAITRLIPITERTLQRKRDSDRLSESVSEQVLQIAEVYSRGKEVFGTIEDFHVWTNLVNRALGDWTPLDLLSSRYGAQMILEELGRIEHGIHS